MSQDQPPEEAEFDWIPPFDLDEFRKHLRAEDDLQKVVRGHLYVEHVLIEFLKVGLPAFDLLNAERLNFPTKVDVSAALQLVRPSLVPPMKKLNSIRNKIAHNLHYRFDDDEKRAFIGAFPSIGRTLIHEDRKNNAVKSFEEVSLFDILIVLVVLLDLDRQRYIEWQRKRKEAFDNATRVLKMVRGEAEDGEEEPDQPA